MSQPPSQQVLLEASARMKKAVEALGRELAAIRTGRASPALLERVRVEYYGVPTPLPQLATISAPEARLLVIQPWERTLLPAVEKAILKSELGLTPTNDGLSIRLSLPPLSEERRQEMIKLVRKKVEGGRVALRNVRQEALEELRKREREKALSRDELLRAQQELQKVTDSFTDQANRVGQEKEAEVLEI